ncbi:hypothetical protein [Flavobacterium sp. JP2137]|uniref:hypothetical protein n=1 Tax=Flavobacterium sp. JP2137 TaxID=3414510 RepID=UPI003D301082
MTKKFYIFLFVALGLLFGPTQAFAAESDSAMSCCTQETGIKDCCKMEGTAQQQHDCDHSCVGTTCGCPSAFNGPTSIFVAPHTAQLILVPSEKAAVFFYSKIFISSDFRSIWLPPKIA